MFLFAKIKHGRYNAPTNLMLGLGFVIFGLLTFFGLGSTKSAKSEGNFILTQPKEDTIRFSIGAIGDIMAHAPQIIAQEKQSGGYDFNNNYDKVRHLFKGIDLMMANLETTLSGKEKRFTGYPMFNAPDELAEAVFNAGIHVVSLANNHIFDRAESGFFRTMEVLKKNSVIPIGVRKDTMERQYIVREVRGQRIGITAYTYETGKIGGQKTINGLLIPEKIEPLLNSFDPSDIKGEAIKMQRMVNQMKADSVDLIVFFMHWGEEYQTTPNKYQVDLASLLNQCGVDLIIGSHPHVVQPFGFIQHPENGHRTFVAYSLGNFISNQRFETLANYHTEDGLMVKVELMIPPGEKISIEKVRYFPLWVNRDRRNNKQYYEVLSCIDYLGPQNEKNNMKLSEAKLNRLENSYKRTMVIVKENSTKFSNSEAFYSVLQNHQ